jgi:DNA polymerase III subunit epsilon
MKIEFITKTDYLVSEINIKNISNQRYCIFDLESTGINHEEEYITQIGAIILENNTIQYSKSFKTYVKSPKPIPEAVERFTGIFNSDIQDAPILSEIYSKFVEFTQDCILVTHAGFEFDYYLLKKECERNNLPTIKNTMLDTKALFSYLYPEVTEIIWTDYLLKYYQIDDEDVRRHDALGDSILIGRIFLRILKEFEDRNEEEIHFIEPVKVRRFEVKLLV